MIFNIGQTKVPVSVAIYSPFLRVVVWECSFARRSIRRIIRCNAPPSNSYFMFFGGFCFLDNSFVISYRDFIKVFLSVSSFLTDDVISEFSSVDNIKIKLVPFQGCCAVDVFE